MGNIGFFDKGRHNGALANALCLELAHHLAWLSPRPPTISYQKYPNISSHVLERIPRCKWLIDAQKLSNVKCSVAEVFVWPKLVRVRCRPRILKPNFARVTVMKVA
jgi:hypothetical protein